MEGWMDGGGGGWGERGRGELRGAWSENGKGQESCCIQK